MTQTKSFPTGTTQQQEDTIQNTITPNKTKMEECTGSDDFDVDSVIEAMDNEVKKQATLKTQEIKPHKKFDFDNKLVKNFHSVQNLSNFGFLPPQKKKVTLIFENENILLLGNFNDKLKETCQRNGATFVEKSSPLLSIIVCSNGIIEQDTLLNCSTKGIPIVTNKWIEDSINNRKKMDTQKYLMSVEQIDATSRKRD
ncbi:hypothetical protein EIN_224660 [Entamoeba invadens IP1]|uniref:BRCT domain-containing protein n=1 Tax=Entamoeba invadens IP1 TaxID=370355 RepID=A0A0A1U8A7_ENTIV|nr:hypothetical protein EIN_224660 [Entamoeba invadens IP1]ELP88213.1 hypothetical protein EIN_224660 [Entamoeba invadens IP1]|eukprot:XP_004254984.1 hypothetical protein EIN_224660 [Entamoeba invadens IP1]